MSKEDNVNDFEVLEKPYECLTTAIREYKPNNNQSVNKSGPAGPKKTNKKHNNNKTKSIYMNFIQAKVSLCFLYFPSHIVYAVLTEEVTIVFVDLRIIDHNYDISFLKKELVYIVLTEHIKQY